MTRAERREQLIDVARALFAERGLEGTAVEEIAARAQVSKPVVYEHFGGKEGLYAVVVDREVRTLRDAIRQALTTAAVNPRGLIELGTLTLLDYIDANPDGFKILSRDSSLGSEQGTMGTILSDIAAHVEDLLAGHLDRAGFDPGTAPLYSQMLVGLVALSGQWWHDNRDEYDIDKATLAAHLVNLAWNGMRHLQPNPTLSAMASQGREDSLS
ncbi:MAG: TetR/AcrR family transcriptional regulator [Propionibacteriaceae bacterium]|nr:TetR/AcrR family transcriptional regulator [Micropruina sp.]